MKLIEFIKAIRLLPQSRVHLIWVKKQLKIIGYQQLIHQIYPSHVSKDSMVVIVKSYFWACRLVKNCDCLPRSIALYQGLKFLGYEVEHKFGVNKKDSTLAAHAWVEYHDEPLNEAVDLKIRFTVLEKSNGDSIESLK